MQAQLSTLFRRSTVIVYVVVIMCSSIWCVIGYQCGHHAAVKVMHVALDSVIHRSDSITGDYREFQDSTLKEQLRNALENTEKIP